MMDILIKGLNDWNITLSENQIQQFEDYYSLLTEWNGKMNLTSIVDYNEVQEKHFLDSLSIVKIIDMESIHTMLDLGSGAGFPGIPIKILCPWISVTLADSLNKRIKFLNTLINKLNLENIYTIHGRAEELSKKKQYRECYDLCVSRAVANLSTLSEYCLPFVRVYGNFIAYKAVNAQDEIIKASRAFSILGGELRERISFKLPYTDYERTLIRVEKIKKTPAKYPRKAGTPSREPL